MVGLSKNYLFKVGEKEAELCHQRQHVCPGLTVEYWYTFNMFKCVPHQYPYEYLYTIDFCKIVYPWYQQQNILSEYPNIIGPEFNSATFHLTGWLGLRSGSHDSCEISRCDFNNYHLSVVISLYWSRHNLKTL